MTATADITTAAFEMGRRDAAAGDPLTGQESVADLIPDTEELLDALGVTRDRDGAHDLSVDEVASIELAYIRGCKAV